MERSQIDHATDTLSPLRELESTNRKLVYLYLAVQGGATIDDLRSDLELTSLTLYRVLPDLREQGLIESEDGEWLCRKRVGVPEVVPDGP